MMYILTVKGEVLYFHIDSIMNVSQTVEHLVDIDRTGQIGFRLQSHQLMII